MSAASPLELTRRLNRNVRNRGARLEVIGEQPFGGDLLVRRYRLGNGLDVALLVNRQAPVVSYQTWFRVGSRNEVPGKTGLAHLFEHLMFKETKNVGPGEFDRLMETAGGDSNAGTWVDWTYYHENLPKRELELAARLESDRLSNLVLDEQQVAAEKDVVQNERRYTVDNDVGGTSHEKLWARAFRNHPYRWPTIGWMRDIRAFTVEDCLDFYATWYAPNNATLVIAGDIDERDALGIVQEYYGGLRRSRIPKTPKVDEPGQRRERRVQISQPTDTHKINIGYHAPPYGDFEYVVLVMLSEVLTGGRSSRLYRDLVVDRELASEISTSISPFQDPGLFGFWADARPGHTGKQLLRAVDREIARVVRSGVAEAELDRARSRLELSFLSGMETAGGKAEQIGFCATVLDDPGAVFRRLDDYARVTVDDVREAASRRLRPSNRTVVEIVPRRGGRK